MPRSKLRWLVWLLFVAFVASMWLAPDWLILAIGAAGIVSTALEWRRNRTLLNEPPHP